MNFEQLLKKQGGFTLNLINGKAPTTGYVVAVSKDSEHVMDPERTDVNMEIDDYIMTWQPEWIGGWMYQGRAYIDAVEVFDGLDAAIDAARERDQLAIFDVETGEVIDL